MANALSGWARTAYLQRESVPVGYRWDDIVKETGRLAYELRPKFKTEVDRFSVSGRGSDNEKAHVYHEFTLRYYVRANDLISELIRNLVSNYDFAHQFEEALEVKSFLPSDTKEVPTFALWLCQTDESRVLFLQGCAISSMEVSVSSGAIAQVAFSGAALKCTEGSLESLAPAHYEQDLLDPRGVHLGPFSNAYLTEDDFTNELSTYRINHVKQMAIKVERTLITGKIGRDGFPDRWRQTSGVMSSASLGMRALSTDLAKYASGQLQASLVLRFGMSSTRYLEALIPSATLTLGPLSPQNADTEVNYSMDAYLKENMGAEGGLALRLVRDDDRFDGGEAGDTDVYAAPGLDGGNAADAMSDDDYTYADFGEL